LERDRATVKEGYRLALRNFDQPKVFRKEIHHGAAADMDVFGGALKWEVSHPSLHSWRDGCETGGGLSCDHPYATQLCLASCSLETEGLDGAYIAEFTQVVLLLSIPTAFRCLIRFMFYSAMRLCGIIGYRSAIVSTYCRSVLVQFTEICHHSTFL